MEQRQRETRHERQRGLQCWWCAHLRLECRCRIGVGCWAGRHDGHIGAVVAQVQESLGTDVVLFETL
jgi:hypothetical protein